MRRAGYRRDIDGLRALAILLVVFFHLFPGPFIGGFIGVDVFFVISGYLITGILLEAHESGAFSFRHFYYRRARRLLPSLLPVLAFCLAAGFVLLTPARFFILSKNVIGGLLFVGNFTLWSDAGYFNVDQDSNPMLHLWSLGVEEQFYLVWPLLLAGVLRFASRFLGVILAGILLASFLFNVALVKSQPDLVFYFPFTRLWEIAVGALLVTFENRYENLPTAMKHAASVIGVVCILAAALILGRNTWYPGWWGLLPTLGAALVILAGPGGLLNSTLLSHPAMVWVGLISYPLYLWHWPLFVFAGFIDLAWSAAQVKFVIIGLSVALAWLSYRFLEQPARRLQTMRGAHYAVTASACILLVSVATYLHNGWYIQAPGGMDYPAKIAALGAPGFDSEMAAQWRDGTCFMGRGQGAGDFVAECTDYRGTEKLVFLWGDSHAAALYPGLLALAEENRFGIAQYTANSCPPALDWQGTINPLCRQTNAYVLSVIEQAQPDLLVLHAGWYMGEYADIRLTDTLQRLKEIGVMNILVVGPAPLWADNVPFLIFDHYRETNEVLPAYADSQLVWSVIDETGPAIEAITVQEGVGYASLTDLLCQPGGCRLYFDDVLEVTALDGSHLTPRAAKYVAGQLVDVLTP